MLDKVGLKDWRVGKTKVFLKYGTSTSFWSNSRDFSSPTTPRRVVLYSARAYWMLTGAYNPMVWPIRVFRYYHADALAAVMVKMTTAATRIQAWWRRFAARIILERLKALAKVEDEVATGFVRDIAAIGAKMSHLQIVTGAEDDRRAQAAAPSGAETSVDDFDGDFDNGGVGVRQRRHCFGTISPHLLALPPPLTHTRARYALLHTHVCRMLIGACNPMACPIHVLRYHARRSPG